MVTFKGLMKYKDLFMFPRLFMSPETQKIQLFRGIIIIVAFMDIKGQRLTLWKHL